MFEGPTEMVKGKRAKVKGKTQSGPLLVVPLTLYL